MPVAWEQLMALKGGAQWTVATAREYLVSRGLEESALRAYRVGFAPDAWERVVTGSKRNGYTDEELLAARLSSLRPSPPG